MNEVAKRKKKEKYTPDAVATFMTDLKRTAIWIFVSVLSVAALAVVIETML